MIETTFQFGETQFVPLQSGALWWPEQSLLCVSDLHLGKSERMARRGGALLPPYESLATLQRLADDLIATGAKTVLSLGDSFDDDAAGDALHPDADAMLRNLMSGRDWIWIEGNHDPRPNRFGGVHHASKRIGAVSFRHIAGASSETYEISGHYHPKASVTLRGRRVTSACFVMDAHRLIMPAYGTYTGGLRVSAPELRSLFAADATVRLIRAPHRAIPLGLVA